MDNDWNIKKMENKNKKDLIKVKALKSFQHDSRKRAFPVRKGEIIEVKPTTAQIYFKAKLITYDITKVFTVDDYSRDEILDFLSEKSILKEISDFDSKAEPAIHIYNDLFVHGKVMNRKKIFEFGAKIVTVNGQKVSGLELKKMIDFGFKFNQLYWSSEREIKVRQNIFSSYQDIGKRQAKKNIDSSEVWPGSQNDLARSIAYERPNNQKTEKVISDRTDIIIKTFLYYNKKKPKTLDRELLNKQIDKFISNQEKPKRFLFDFQRNIVVDLKN